MIVTAPKDGNELRDLLWTGLEQDAAPFAVRYPRGSVPEGFEPQSPPGVIPIGTWQRLREGSDAAFLAVGTMVETALRAREILMRKGIQAAVINCRFVKPMDCVMLREVREEAPVLVTVEENTVLGGFGDGVLDLLDEGALPREGVVRLGLPDDFVTHGTREQLLEEVGLTPVGLADATIRALERGSD